jgi:hypothetical protein
VNIVGTVASMSGAPRPAFVAGLNTMAPGDLYVPSSTVVNGDVVLSGTNLHVNGDFTVNGSITGEGSIYVNGDTRFQGTARVSSARPDKTALYSQGSIALTGYDGTKFMQDIADGGTDPLFTAAWNQTTASMADFQVGLNSPTPAMMGSMGYLDSIRSELAQYLPGGSSPRAGRTTDSLGTLITRLNLQPPSPSRDFMIAKLTDMQSTMAAYNPLPLGPFQTDLGNGIVGVGAFDTIFDEGGTVADLPALASYVNSCDYSKLGSAYFQGVLYSHGAIYATGDVTVIGGTVARDNGTQPPFAAGALTLNPGDVYLTNGTRLTYVEDFFGNGGLGSSSGPMAITLWMAR